MSLKWKVVGIQDSVKRLEKFKRRFRTRALKRAGTEGSKIILPVVKTNAPVAKKDYGKGGSLKRSMGKKVQVKGDRMWFGVGPRTGYMKEVAKKNRFWRDKKTGRIRKAPLNTFKSAPTREWRPGGVRFERPSRRAHFSERRTGFLKRTMRQTMGRANERMRQVLEEECAGV